MKGGGGVQVMTNVDNAGGSRLMLHSIVYQHKTAKCLEVMLADIFALAHPHLSFTGDDGYLPFFPYSFDSQPG